MNSIDTDMNISPVFGTSGNDVLTGTGRSEVISGAGGDDIITALSGDDEVFGGTGNDILMGNAGNDIMYGNGKPAYVQMDQIVSAEQTTATVTFIDEGAGFRNALGVYEIGKDGSISNVQILFANASKVGSGGDLVPGKTQVTFDVNEGAQLGFFVVSNGYNKGSLNQKVLSAETGHFELRNLSGQQGNIADKAVELWYVAEDGKQVHVQSQYGYSIFHSIGDASNNFAPNPDQYSHIVARANTVAGQLMLGFEDLWGGGDKDYDDCVITVELGKRNIEAMLPEKAPSSVIVPDDDIIYGGDGDDTMYGVAGDDKLYGGNGNDMIQGNSGDDYAEGNAGNDVIQGNSGADTLSGGDGNDVIEGNSDNDTLYGDGGDDRLSGGSGDDALSGGSNNDILNGDSGNDFLDGGSGDDTLNGGSGDDWMQGDSGNDKLDGNSGNDVMLGGSGQDELLGGSGNDWMEGGDHNDRLVAGSGEDTLLGGSGDDYLSGGANDDYLQGGEGKDKLLGGAGSDTFAFVMEGAGPGMDTIFDFEAQDILLFAGWAEKDLEALSDHIGQDGANAVIDMGAGNMLVIRDFDADLLTADNFMFA
jgi:serralysin